MEGKLIAQVVTLVTLVSAVILGLVYFTLSAKVSEFTTNLTTTIVKELEFIGLSDNSIVLRNPEQGVVSNLSLVIDEVPVLVDYEVADDLIIIDLGGVDFDPSAAHNFVIVTSNGNFSGSLSAEQSRELVNNSMVCGNGICSRGESCASDCLVELFCSDGVDNDVDGLVDVNDSDCDVCGNGVCESSEDCFSCETDCLDSGMVCCDSVALSGDCCDNFDCAADYECVINVCTLISGFCGDGECDVNESCAVDCQSELYCSDGVDNDVDGVIDLVDSDCIVCGDGVCDDDESCTSCPSDCLNSSTHVCCYGVPVLGDCCSDTFCPEGYACNVNTCELKCGNGVCQSGENCGNCPVDCLDNGEVCCGNAVKVGDCCVDANCSQAQACVDYSCTDLVFCGADALSQGQLCCDSTVIAGDCCTDSDCSNNEYCLDNHCTSLCGNQVCDNSEDCESCPIDCECATEVQCGDGVCDDDESCTSCPVDCGICNSFSSEEAYSLQALCWSLGLQVEVQSNEDDAFSLTLLDECLEAIGCGNQLCGEGKYCVEGSCEDCVNECDGECESPFCINDPDCAFVECCGNGVCGLAEECAIDCAEVCGDQVDNDENGLIDDGCEQTLTQFSDGSTSKSLIYEEPGEQEVSITLPIGAIVSGAKFTVEGKQHWSSTFDLDEGSDYKININPINIIYLSWLDEEGVYFKSFDGELSDAILYPIEYGTLYYDLVVDLEDNIHIVYEDSSALYVNNENGDWSEPLEIDYVQWRKYGNFDLEINSLNNLHLIFIRSTYTSNDELIYAEKTTDWLTEVIIDPEVTFLNHPKLAIDSLNQPHIVYDLNGQNGVFYLTKEQESWTQPIVLEQSLQGYTPNIAIDYNNEPHVVYRNNFKFNYAKKTNNEWTIEQSLGNFIVGVTPQIVINNQDNVYIATYEKLEGENQYDIYIRNSLDDFSSSEVIASEEFNFKNPKLAVDDYNNLYVIWRDYDNLKNNFKYKSYPKDITIGIGSPYGLDVPGYFSSVYPFETGLDLQLNSIVSDCQCPFCTINGGQCTFTLSLGSSAAGQIDVSDLEIVYSVG